LDKIAQKNSHQIQFKLIKIVSKLLLEKIKWKFIILLCNLRIWPEGPSSPRLSLLPASSRPKTGLAQSRMAASPAPRPQRGPGPGFLPDARARLGRIRPSLPLADLSHLSASDGHTQNRMKQKPPQQLPKNPNFHFLLLPISLSRRTTAG
jgi:hypothetical protein